MTPEQEKSKLLEHLMDELVWCGKQIEHYQNPSLRPLSEQNGRMYNFAIEHSYKCKNGIRKMLLNPHSTVHSIPLKTD
jgi:hypothetical protein